MKISAKSNIYEVTAESIFEAYAPFVQRPASGQGCLTVAVSNEPLSDVARNALEKSFQSLGCGARTCAFATRYAEGMEMGGQELLSIVEGLDPLCLVVADTACIDVLSQGYRAAIEPDAVGKLLGRPTAAFANFEAMMQTPPEKQRAWALLKKLA